MPTIEKRIKSDGKEVYRVKVRRRGYSTQTATFGRIYEFGDRASSNKASKRPLTQASLRCTR
jgi:hypothetical protein